MTQKQFVIGLIEAEVNRDLEQQQGSAEMQNISSEQDEPNENEQEDVTAEEDAVLDEFEPMISMMRRKSMNRRTRNLT